MRSAACLVASIFLLAATLLSSSARAQEDVLAKIAAAEAKLRAAKKFDLNLHNELRHLYTVAKNPRKAMEQCNAIFRELPQNPYTLDVLSGTSTNEVVKASALGAIAHTYRDLPALAFACRLRAADLKGEDDSIRDILREISATKDPDLAKFRGYADAVLNLSKPRRPGAKSAAPASSKPAVTKPRGARAIPVVRLLDPAESVPKARPGESLLERVSRVDLESPASEFYPPHKMAVAALAKAPRKPPEKPSTLVQTVTALCPRPGNEEYMPVYVDPAGLREANVSPDVQVSVTGRATTLASAIAELVRPLGLTTYLTSHCVIVITSPARVERNTRLQMSTPERFALYPLGAGLPYRRNTDFDGKPRTSRQSGVETRLYMPVSIPFPKPTPLGEFDRYLTASTMSPGRSDGLSLKLEEATLKTAGATMDSKVLVNLDGVPLGDSLAFTLDQLGLAYRVREDGTLGVIPTPLDPIPLTLERPAMPSPAARAEFDKLRGAWAVESATVDGKPGEPWPVTFIFEGMMVGQIYDESPKREIIGAPIVLDPSRDPKWIDWRFGASGLLNEVSGCHPIQFTYKITGDRLILQNYSARSPMMLGGAPFSNRTPTATTKKKAVLTLKRLAP